MEELRPVPRPYRRSGRSAKARLRVAGKEVFLGDWGSAEADANLRRIREHIAEHGMPPKGFRPADYVLAPRNGIRQVWMLGDLFLQHARNYYRKGDRATKTVHTIARALKLLDISGLSRMHHQDFGPLALKTFQEWLACDPKRRWSRRTINGYGQVIVGMYRWAASQEFVDHALYERLTTVGGLRKGRRVGPALQMPREGRKVRPPDSEALEAFLEAAPPMLKAMVELQTLTGMRPTELCGLRGKFLRPTATPGVVAYHVPDEHNKLDHMQISRVVYIGPRGMAVLRPWLSDDPEAYAFSPAKSEAMRLAEIRAGRTLKLWPSHRPEVRRKRRHQERISYREFYSTDAYGRAIRRVVEAINRKRAEGGQEALPVFSPNRLRHLAASVIAERERIEVAQLLLGHADISTTMRYVEVSDPRAVLAALRHS